MTPAPARSVFGADHAVFRDSARRFVSAEVVPALNDWRRNDGVSSGVITEAGRNGFLATRVPERFGGGDADDDGFLAVLIDETVDVGATGLAIVFALHSGVAIPLVHEHAIATSQEQWLPAMASGDAIAIPLPGPLASGLPGGRLADLLLMTDDTGAVTLLPRQANGLKVTPVSGNLAGREAGIADISVRGAVLDNCTRIPDGAAAIRRDVDLWLAVVALSSARKAIDLALEYASSRMVFGRALTEFENTQLRLAELSAELAPVTTYVHSCLAARAEQALTGAAAAAARHTSFGLADRAADQSLQLHGGYGYMREYAIAQIFADTRFLRAVGALFSDPRRTVAAGLFSSSNGDR